jgi:Icc-related predicted phosphoesterase
MTLLIIADDDSVAGQVPDARVDLLVACGDLTDETIRRVASRCTPRHIFAVKGNHDSNAPFEAPIENLHLQMRHFGGMAFGGFAGSWKYKPRGHHLFEQSEVDAALRTFPRVDIFVSHNSPRLVHDRDDDVHIGFTAFNSYIATHHPRYLLHGHQHMNQETVVGSTRIIGTYGFRQLVIPS